MTKTQSATRILMKYLFPYSGDRDDRSAFLEKQFRTFLGELIADAKERNQENIIQEVLEEMDHR